MKCLLILLLLTHVVLGQSAKPNNSSVKPYVVVVPKSFEQEQAEKFALVDAVVSRYGREVARLDQLRAKYPNSVGEDEAHVLGRHYAELADTYQRSAIPIGERLREDFNDFREDPSVTNPFRLSAMVVDAQHLDLILDGLQGQDKKWLRSHAKDRIEPGVVIVVKQGVVKQDGVKQEGVK